MTTKDHCFLIPKGPPCFIQLGRYGDIIQLLPAFKAIQDRIGESPVVIVSDDYASVLEGVSYVKPWKMRLHWWEGVPAARKAAKDLFATVVVPQFWNDDHDKWMKEINTAGIVLQCHGHEWGVDMALDPDYGTSMWRRAGFSADEMRKLPLVFDKRDKERENALALSNLHPGRPNLLINFDGISSPFPYTPEVMSVIREFRTAFNLVDIGKIRAKRIYDLLGLYDRAAGMVTIDTSTIHLAPASQLPYVAYTRSDWSHSVPKGNCKLEIRYHEGLTKREQLRSVLKAWAENKKLPQHLKVTPFGGGSGRMLATV